MVSDTAIVTGFTGSGFDGVPPFGLFRCFCEYADFALLLFGDLDVTGLALKLVLMLFFLFWICFV